MGGRARRWTVVVVALFVAGSAAACGGSSKGAEVSPVHVTGLALDHYPGVGVRDPAVGAAAPYVEGRDFAGKAVQIGIDGRSKIVLVVAHWCPACQRDVRVVRSWLDENRLPTGVALYLVVTGTARQKPNYPPSAWLSAAGLGDVPTLVDSGGADAARAYGLTMLPLTPYWVLLDTGNHVLGRFRGELKAPAFDQVVAGVAKGEPIEIDSGTTTTTEWSEGTTTTTEEEPGASTTTTAAPSGEMPNLVGLIGKGWNDPTVYALVSQCGYGHDVMASGNIACRELGFELTLNGELVVVKVTVFNDEGPGHYRQYQGPLPYGLTWNDTYESILSKLGDPDQRWGGFGVEINLRYERLGPYVVEVYLTATHDRPEEVAGAGIHLINIAPPE